MYIGGGVLTLLIIVLIVVLLGAVSTCTSIPGYASRNN